VTDFSGVAVQYPLPTSLPEWELPEVQVSESPLHDEVTERLKSVLSAWHERAGLPGSIRRNLAIRWDPSNPKVGVDPDLCWAACMPPGIPDGGAEGELGSLRLWLPGNAAPPLAVEVVSRHPYKDYARVQEKYAVIGVHELWVYDPGGFGPRALGGPVLLQLWARSPEGVLVRRYFSNDPVQSELTGAWLVPQARGHLVLANDPAGREPWPTREASVKARADEEKARADRLQAELETLRAERKREG
jgi:Uma2 family endonuclease